MFSKLKLFTGNANPELAKEVATFAGIPLGDAEVFKFSNDDTFVKINDNVRGADAFIIQSTCYPVNDNMMELLIMIDALKRASAQRISVVIPYYGYARSDKKDQPRVPITAKLVADLITVAGADRVITVDLHADQIQGFFNIPVDHLYSIPIFARYFKSMGVDEDNLVVVSPDSGGANRARSLAKRLNCSLAIGDKRRTGNDNNAEVLNVIGDVKGKVAILFDDIIDTGGSLIKIANKLAELGAEKVYAACVHGVLSGTAVDKLEQSPIEKLFITNTIPLNEQKKNSKKIIQLSIAELLATAIKKIHLEESISILFR
ncbi:MAG TPA: ribose-phosphate pyrophosphokinase [Candidatus Cloacimonadota bacterium]|nr:ribose-phosphate pyrophosphokinase [Candidatus Cloacimonadota bacterium]HOD53878.1 ribose-phosphate pyrophosphokinase [Candidatus Cloacimonadota bacterium]HPM00844.1 ribose-phosphate pyrophosphokinase [Candidatus Cloacimonadota bacterium]